MKSQITYVLMLTALLCLVSVQTGMSLQQTNRAITSSGTINYEDYFETMIVEFENPEDFYTPKDPATGYVWASQQSWWTLNNPNMHDQHFEPATDIVHSGSQSARLALTNPVDEDSRRIHIYHEWGDLVNETHIWFECWYYFPEGTVVESWVQFHSSLSEKYFTRTGPVHWHGFPISITEASKVADGEYRLQSSLNHGWIDEDGDNENDMPPQEFVRSNDTMKFGEWFKITTYIYRSLDPAEGIYKCWLNDVLQWNITNIRTQGFDPMLVDDPRWGGDGVTLVRDLPRTGGQQRYLFNSGLSLYTIYNAEPKTIYCDDAMLKHLAP